MEDKKQLVLLKQDLKTITASKKVSTVLELTIIIALIGLFQFATLNFNFSAFLESSFYTKLLYRVVLIYLAYTVGLEMFFDKHYYSETIIGEKETYKQLLKFKDRDTFPEFIKQINFRRKTAVYKKQFEKKINKIEKKLMNVLPENKRKELVSQLDYYKSLLSEEYINEHLDNIQLKYKIVYESDFNGSEFSDGTDSLKTRSDYQIVKGKYTLKKMGIFMIFSIVVGIALKDALWNGFTLLTMVNLLSDLMFVLLRFKAGINDSERAINEAFLLPILNKNELLKEYIESNKTTMSKVEKVVQYIEEQKG